MYTVFEASFYRVRESVSFLAPLVARHGMGGINVPLEILDDARRAREAARVVADQGLRWGMLPTPADLLSAETDDDAFDEALRVLDGWAAVAEKIGVDRSYSHVFPGSNSMPFAANFEWHVRRVGQVARILQNHGIRYSLEFVGPRPLRNSFSHPFVDSLSGVLAIADAVDANVGFLFDTYHWFCGGGRTDDLYLAAQHVDRMTCLHLNDGVAGIPVDQQEDLVRAMPMTTGVIDSATPLRLFVSRGFTGPVICEPMWPVYGAFEAMAPQEVVATVGEAYAQLLDLAGLTR